MTLAPIIFLGCLIFWIANLIYVKYKERKLIELVTPITRGEWSERRVILNLLKEGINPKAIFHDLYIQKQNGEYTQVDVAVATKTGIIVFEVKDYSGWIFGNEHQRYWTQILAYGKEKHRFYNPVMQNAGHIKAIRRCLPQNPGIPIYSVIVFFGSSEFKNITCNADNTFIIYPHSIRQVVSEILRQPDANFGNKYEIMCFSPRPFKTAMTIRLLNRKLIQQHIMVATSLDLHTPNLLLHYSVSGCYLIEGDFGNQFIIRMYHVLVHFLALSQYSSHTDLPRHRQSPCPLDIYKKLYYC